MNWANQSLLFQEEETRQNRIFWTCLRDFRKSHQIKFLAFVLIISWSLTNDHTIGWQNLKPLSYPNATLVPQARQARPSGENLNYMTLAPQARQVWPNGEILNYSLSPYSYILSIWSLSLTSLLRCSPWSSASVDTTPAQRWSGQLTERTGCSRSPPSHWNIDKYFSTKVRYFSPLPCHPPSIGEQTYFTKVWSITERGGHVTVLHHYVNNTLLYEVHLGAYGSLLDYYITYKDNRCFLKIKIPTVKPLPLTINLERMLLSHFRSFFCS